MDDIFVNLVLVAAERHSHFIEPDIAPQRFHLIDGFHVELLGFINGAVEFLETAQRVVALIRNPGRVIAFDFIQSFLGLLKGWRSFRQLQPALSRKYASIRRPRGSLLSLKDFG